MSYVWERVQTLKHGEPIVPKEPEHASAYYMRFTENGKRITRPLGANFEDAVNACRNKEVEREYIRRGLNAPNAVAEPKRRTIADAVAEFIEEQSTLDKSKATVYGYGKATRQFADVCLMAGKTYMDEIDRASVLAFMKWIQAGGVKTRGFGQRAGTIRTKLQYLSVFFLRNGLKNPLPKKEWPKVDEQPVEAFTIDEINLILSKATVDETDLVQFFLYTGFRDNEAAHTFYSDVDFAHGTINIANKPQLGFVTKNRKQRKSDITLPAAFVQRLQERRARNPESDLIFPNSQGRPNSDLLAAVRKAAERAGYREHFGLHKFRKTFGTLYGEKFGVVNAQHLLGHASILTTQKYMAKTKISKSEVEDLFAAVADAPWTPNAATPHI